jgi:DNA-directed RNA polymerase subunit RPC12/RpoP
MLSDMDQDDGRPAQPKQDDTPTAPCPQCGFPMVAIRGSRDAVCPNCGFKDSCCY